MLSKFGIAIASLLNMIGSDFVIIYLATGAPFGAIYFFENRHLNQTTKNTLISVATILFWIPSAIRLFKKITRSITGRAKNSDLSSSPIGISDDLVVSAQKSLEKHFAEKNSNVSLYEFRDTIERYNGLTLEIRKGDANTDIPLNQIELQFLKNFSCPDIFQACLIRKNKAKLNEHQAAARIELFRLIEMATFEDSEWAKVTNLLRAIFEKLNDSPALLKLGEVDLFSRGYSGKSSNDKVLGYKSNSVTFRHEPFLSEEF